MRILCLLAIFILTSCENNYIKVNNPFTQTNTPTTVITLVCNDDNRDWKTEWNVVINKESRSITWYDRTYTKNFMIIGDRFVAERVKDYAGNTRYYDNIEYNKKTKKLIRSTTEVPLVKNHPRLSSSESYTTISTCKTN